jgi:hypothetical protein
MPYKEDKRIDFPIPCLTERTVFYVGNENDLFRAEELYISRASVVDLFRSYGKKLVFLSDILKTLNPDMLRYMFPGQDDLVVEEVYKRLVEAIGTGECPGFLYRQQGGVYFHVVTATDSGKALEDIRDFVSSISVEVERLPMPSVGSTLFSVEAEENESRQYERRLNKERGEKEERKKEKKGPSFIDMLFSDQEEKRSKKEAKCSKNLAEREQLLLDPRVQAILDAWRKIEQEFGISIEVLELLLGYKVELSKLIITTSSRLFLTDFDNQEVKMNDLTKALYFFFLRHPEGARLKELHEHEDEIVHIYSSITGRDDTKKIRKSVQNLLDPFGNNLNVSMSRIKKAFKDVVSDRVARFYYVSGSYGETRNVGLDRDLVIWEH